MTKTPNASWQMHFGRSLDLRSPDGQPVGLPYAKLSELLARLAQAPGRQMGRLELGQLLWPGIPEKRRRDNVRQAIHRLRSVLGPELLIGERELCSLSREVKVTFTAEWKFAACAPVGLQSNLWDEEVPPIVGFMQMLRWLAENDTFQMLDMMRSNVDICIGLSMDELRHLLVTAQRKQVSSRLLKGWEQFWWAYTSLADLPKAIQLYESACNIGRETGDYLLTTEAIHWLSACQVLSGDLKAAQKVASVGADFSSGLHNKEFRARMYHAMGNALLHQGLSEEAIHLYERANPFLERRVLDWAQNEALRSLYEASSGHASEAAWRLETPRRMAAETKHGRLQGLCHLAAGHIALAEHCWETAVKEFSVFKDRDRHGHFHIYAKEGMAVALSQMNETDTAAGLLNISSTARRGMKMATSEWDRSRMRLLSPELCFN